MLSVFLVALFQLFDVIPTPKPSRTMPSLGFSFWFGSGAIWVGWAVEESSPPGFIFSGWILTSVFHACNPRRRRISVLLFPLIV